MQSFRRSVELPVSAERAFAWHERKGCLPRLIPPWQRVRLLERSGAVRDGDITVLQLGLGPASIRWVAEHRDYESGRQFCDVQRKGPFKSWLHTHRFEPRGENACVLHDEIDYALPLASLGSAVAGRKVRRDLERSFIYRHRITREDLTLHETTRDHPRLKVAISGASGLVGDALSHLLTSGGHSVRPLVRHVEKKADEIQWDPQRGVVDLARLDGVDAVVHLAGEPIASGRWSPQKMRMIRDSRVEGTRSLCESLAAVDAPPRVLISASAVGYYGDRGDEPLTEQSKRGRGFLADVAAAWEEAADPAREAGVRVVHPRLGMVLSPEGGALKKLLMPAKLGVSSEIGAGRQWVSWISRDDAISAFCVALMNESVSGPVNVVAPNAVTNREFAQTLASVLGRPSIGRMPAWLARVTFGQMADEVLLASQRVVPQRLLDLGFEFRTPTLENALRHLLGRQR